MIGLDTNVVLRFIMQDDPGQSAIANEIFAKRLSREKGFISNVVMVETAWVLQRRYRLNHAQIALAIERILQTENLIVENEQEVFVAFVALQEAKGEFADALIGALGTTAGCRCTLTFDRKAQRLPGFENP